MFLYERLPDFLGNITKQPSLTRGQAGLHTIQPGLCSLSKKYFDKLSIHAGVDRGGSASGCAHAKGAHLPDQSAKTKAHVLGFYVFYVFYLTWYSV